MFLNLLERIMKFVKKLNLLAILLSAVFSFNVSAQTDLAERLDVKNIMRVDKDKKSNTQDNESNIIKEVLANSSELITATTYPFTSGTAALEDMSSGTTQILGASLDDNASAVTNIGFEFWLDGVRYTQFSANANGLMKLGSVVVDSSTNGRTNDFATANDLPKIATYWDDLCTSATGKVHYKVIGSAPSRKLVVEFQNMIQYSSGCTAGVSAGTFQVWLFESTGATTPGTIEFVYGAIPVNSNTNTGYSVGIGSSATSFASVTTSTNSVSYAASNNTQVNAIAATTAYLFTPNVPAAPTGLSFTAITPTSQTLNWTDTSSNEFGFLVYRSTDGINYTLITQTAAGATSYNDTGLSPSTNYFYRVFSVSEGALSTAAATGSQTTAAAATDTCSATPTIWTATTSWLDGTVPTAGDNVVIQSGCTMIINTTAPVALNVTVQSGGTLVYDTAATATLTANADVTVDAGGTFTAGAGVLLTHVLNIGGSTTASAQAGNLTVNGTFDMNTTAGVTTQFWGSADGTLSGTGATCDFFAIVMQKGTTQTPVLDVTRVITGNTPAASANRLSATNGTFKLSSASTWTPWFGTQTLTAATGRIWINNAGATLTVVGVGTNTGAGSPTVNGGLRVDAGTWGYGSGNNALTIGAAGNLTIGGGTVNMFGTVTFTAGCTFNMTGGNFNVDVQAANATAATNNIVRFNTVTVAFTGGTLTIVDPHAATGTGKALSISTSNAAIMNFIGGTIRFGDGVSSTAGSVDGFDIDTFVSTAQPILGNVVVDNTATNAATRFVRVNTALSPFQILITNLTTTAAGGSRFNLNGNLTAITGNVVNDGILDGTVAASRLYWSGAGTPSTYSGAGTSVAPLVSWDIDNPLGVTINPAVTNVVVRRVILFSGSLTNSNKLTLGNGDATVNPVQIGNTTTATAAGTFDVPFTFNLGAGGQSVSYLRTTANRTTGPEINPTRTLVALTYDDNAVGRTLTVAGGNLTVSGALTLTNGVIVTSPTNTLVHNGAATRTTGYVDGPLVRQFGTAGTAAYTFHVGEGAYTPVALTAITSAGAADLSVESINQMLTPFFPADAISRNWSLNKTGAGTLTATVAFTYDQADDVQAGNDETDFRLYRRDTANPTEVCGVACVDETTNTATIAALSSFSRWTVAEAFAPLAASVNIGGRVTTADGVTGLGKVQVVLSGSTLSQPKVVTTSPFGYYNFEELPVGTYVLQVASKQYTFSVPTRVVTAEDNITSADFTANP
jgi:hypothetical protein